MAVGEAGLADHNRDGAPVPRSLSLFQTSGELHPPIRLPEYSIERRAIFTSRENRQNGLTCNRIPCHLRSSIRAEPGPL